MGKLPVLKVGEVVRPRRALQAFIGLAGGIACAEFLSLPTPALLVLSLTVGLAILLFPSAWIVGLVFLVGWWHYTGWQAVPFTAPPTPARLQAIGMLEPTRNGWRLLCRFVEPPIEGYALVYFRPSVARPPDYGDEFVLNAEWRRPQNWRGAPFDWARFLQRRRVHHLATVFHEGQFQIVHSGERRWQRWFISARHNLRQHLKAHFSREHSAIVEGMLVGAAGDFPPELRERFMRSGIGHLLATSGLHVGLALTAIGGTLYTLSVPFRWRIGVIMLCAWGYALLAGLRPSIVRAGIMTTLYLGAPLVRREADSLSALAMAGVIWLMIAPSSLFEVGFQYSFSAVLFILLFYTKLYRWLSATRIRSIPAGNALCSLLSVTLCAQAGVALLQLYHFGHFSLLSPIANLLVVPIALPVLVLGFLFWGAQGIFAGLQFAIGLPLSWLCEWLSWVAHAFGSEGVPAVRVAWLPAWLVVLLYGVVLLLAREPRGELQENES